MQKSLDEKIIRAGFEFAAAPCQAKNHWPMNLQMYMVSWFARVVEPTSSAAGKIGLTFTFEHVSHAVGHTRALKDGMHLGLCKRGTDLNLFSLGPWCW